MEKCAISHPPGAKWGSLPGHRCNEWPPAGWLVSIERERWALPLACPDMKTTDDLK